jgi:RNA polymerase sigma-70 factor (ECF subfamily)
MRGTTGGDFSTAILPMDEPAQIRLAQRDPSAFGPLYETYADAVYRYCHRRLGNPDAAADATSAIFTRALSALPRYHHVSFRSWLFAIAHNTLVDGWRTTRHPVRLEMTAAQANPEPGPEEIALDADAGREIRNLLRQLPTDQRHVIELRLAGLTNQEIADTLGRSVAATKMLQVRALARLRTLLSPEPARGDGGWR